MTLEETEILPTGCIRASFPLIHTLIYPSLLVTSWGHVEES